MPEEACPSCGYELEWDKDEEEWVECPDCDLPVKFWSAWREQQGLTLNSYQDAAMTTAQYPKGTGIAYTALGLAAEAGEYANLIKKLMRGDPDGPATEDLVKELGDALWYIAGASKELGLTLQEVATANLVKLAKRAARDLIKGTGDDR